MSIVLRPAEKSDFAALNRFIHAQNYIHHHLDWRETLDWLSRQPFLLMEESHQIKAVLACPPEPPEVAWVRLFGVSPRTSPERAWQSMFERAIETLHTHTPRPALVSLSLRDWYSDLLQRHRFTFHQDIVVFIYDTTPPIPPQMPPEFRLRPMQLEDIPEVIVIDNQSFEPIWRLSEQDMQYAYQKSAYMTVAEYEGKIVGYQMSSSTGFYAHLARLAVSPAMQRRRIGFAMVQDLLEYFINQRSCWGVTLNTQHNNTSSIALYQSIGFHKTGERFPVFIYNDSE